MNMLFRFWFLILSATVAIQTAAAQADEIPHLVRRGDASQLIVDGKPFLIRGGELGNSSSASLEYLRPLWPKFSAMHLNTIVAPVYWDLIEPSEGRFDFTLVEGVIQQARDNKIRLVLLWFGSWKNSMSCYAPSWVKIDQRRFPRAQGRSGHSEEILSPFSESNRDTDARAFAALMRHLKAFDGTQHTVVLVQVENEIGMIPSARDQSDIASKLFNEQVPAELMRTLQTQRDHGALVSEFREAWAAAGNKTSGTWAEVFGSGAAADECFMAWYFGRYTDHVAEQGKLEYPLPMYVNAALIRPGYQPGQYPSAGPLPHLFDIWRAAAPHIDLFSPDIYFPNFIEWTGKYVRQNNPLFIPEALRDRNAGINALYAFGQHSALGFCPFGIESITEPAQGLLEKSFGLLEQLTPLLIEHRGTHTTVGLLPSDREQRQPQQIRLGEYLLNVVYEQAQLSSLADGVIVPEGANASSVTTLPAGGLAIALGPDEFLFAGIGVTITFDSLNAGERVGLLNVQEGKFVDGQWKPGRWLGGDQTHQGRHVRLEPGRFDIQRVKLYRYR